MIDHRPDWLDDFTMMEMMEEDEQRRKSGGGGDPGTGCLGPLCLAGLLFFIILSSFS